MKDCDPVRAIYCNRTLNLRAIKAIGYDMDYTLVQYNVQTWERVAFEHLSRKLFDLGWPVEGMSFDPQMVVRGLVIDRQCGNLCKANRFGYVKLAYHGTRPLEFDAQRRVYSQTLVDLSDHRWVFLNTLFAISEACMYMQLVDEFDRGGLKGILGYADLYDQVRRSLDEAHMEGLLKSVIVANPERYVELDPLIPLTLRDQRESGKKILLITNSGLAYTDAMMSYALDRFCEPGTTWRDLFDLVIVEARKPGFFSQRVPILEVIDKEGSLRPMIKGLSKGGTYWGGNAAEVEAYLGASGSEILYVGDHLYGDVHQSKSVRRWRTALIMSELEGEMKEIESFRDKQIELSALMKAKAALEDDFSQARLAQQRLKAGYGPSIDTPLEELQAQMARARALLVDLDAKIGILARESSELYNRRWGLLMRTGNDKSHMARQLERHADIYTSRVSNFLGETPFSYIRSPRGSLPHDM